jgi:hypothetical protein
VAVLTDSLGVALNQSALEVYRQERAAKFLATLSHDGVPNVALIVSQIPAEPGIVVFGEFMMVKTLANLKEDPVVASIAITEKLEMAGFKGQVTEWTKMGEYVDLINSIDFFRYNAYAGIHNVAVVKLTSILDIPAKLPIVKVGQEFLAIRGRGALARGKRLRGADVPRAIRAKFASLMSIKVLAFKGADGKPDVVPVFASLISPDGELRFMVSSYNRRAQDIPLGSTVALNVLTLELLTYQVKGELVRFDNSLGVREGVVRLTEAYSCVPPFCGQRVT